ncbi:MAG TPA: cytochrome c, partial [Segetibacter sp.]
MILHRRIVKTIVSLVLVVSCFFGNKVFAQANGQALFSSQCASCHAVHKDLTGPALAGVEERWGDKAKLYSWIRNNQAFLKTGDKYANELYLKYNKTQMNLFPNLTDPEIDAILGYIKSVP